MSGDEIILPKNDIATTIKFSVISEILEKISSEKESNKRSELFKTYMVSFKKHSLQFKSQHGENSIYNAFPVLRLLMPAKDSLRGSYGIQINKMGKLLVRALGIDLKGNDANKLTSPSEADYSMVVYNVTKNRCKSISTITVYEVNNRLDNIADFYNKNLTKKIDEELFLLIQNMTALDLKWITRIILKKTKTGLGPDKMFTLYDPLAKDLYAKCSSLKTTCERIDSGTDISEIQPLEPFSAIRPMLCERRNISELGEMLSSHEYYAQTKMDGERFQLHMNNGEFRYFSRNGFDYTHAFGFDCKNGSLTPFMHQLIKNLVKNVILDGEMMVWNKLKKCFHTKGEGHDVKAISNRESNLVPCFVTYDVLYLNNNSIISKSYAERNRLLETLISEEEGVLVRCKATRVKNCQHLLDYLNNAIDNKEEGIVIKDIDSLYRPDVRNNGGWYKIKPDYIDGAVADFDLMIIGGFYNSRKTYIESYLLGVLKDRNDDISTCFYSVGTVNIGLSNNTRRELGNQLKPHWKIVKTNKENRKTIPEPPEGMIWGTQFPDVWIDPRSSVILKIEATELFQSEAFGTNYTLRFPRIVEIRSDKVWRDCCTLEEYNLLSEHQNKNKVVKITKRHISAKDLNPPESAVVTKKLKISNRNQRNVIKPTTSINILPSCEINRVDEMCRDKTFCILSIKPENALKELILKRGGKIVVHPPKHGNPNLICIAANGRTPRVLELAATKEFNIVTVAWLQEALSFRRKSLPEFEPNDLVAISRETQSELALRYDQFGDSFTQEYNTEKMMKIIRGIDDKELPRLLRSELYSTEIDVLKADHSTTDPFHFMRPFCGFFCGDSFACELAKLIFRRRGGHIAEEINECVTYLFVDPNNVNRSEIDVLIRASKVKPISFEWIRACHKAKKRVSKRKYRILFSNKA